MTIARYSFLPWLRRGLAAHIQIPAAGNRAAVPVTVTVGSDADPPRALAPKFVELIGPGDVLGIQPQAIIRTEPRNGVNDFEPNYLAFVEFYDEDFAWRYTPAPADTNAHRLIPWVTLLVLEASEFEVSRRPGRPLPSVKLGSAETAGVFAPKDQLWAWAHVHVNQRLGDVHTPNLETLEVALRRNPDTGYCRVLSPRRLAPNTAYHAFVVPTFEVGRKAGLGEAVGSGDAGVAIAWETAREFPILYQWRFRTGPGGDFEELAQRLEPRPVPKEVGIRDLDIQSPGFGIGKITSLPDDVVGLEGALLSPETEPKPLHPASDLAPKVVTRVNLAADVAQAGVQTGADEDPVVGIPLYGRWHALVERISAQPEHVSWVDELNRDPRFRSYAGMGTLVVQKNQEEYMRLAWQQIGEILAANRKVHFLQMALKASQAAFVKHVAPLDDARALALTAPVFAKVMGSPVTVHQLVRESPLTRAALSGAMRKLLRPRGPLVRRALAAEQRRAAVGEMARRINEGAVFAAPPRPAPGGPTLEAATEAVLPATSRLARWLLDTCDALAALALIALLAPLVAAPGVAAAVVVGVLGVALGYAYHRARRLRARIEAIESLAPVRLTPAAVANIPPNSGFVLAAPGEPPYPGMPTPGGAASGPSPGPTGGGGSANSAGPRGLPPGGSSDVGDGPSAAAAPPRGRAGVDSIDARDFRLALMDFHALLSVRVSPPATRPPIAVAPVRRTVMSAVEPIRAFPLRAAGRLRVGDVSLVTNAQGYHDAPATLPDDRIVPAMAYPDIKRPMYEPLRDLSVELFVPNLDLVPNNTVSMMIPNQPFIEAYMVGLNHEFGRELLWREYPTDQRPSSFRQFWDVSNAVDREGLPPEQLAEKLRDITRIHEWSAASRLGDHDNRGAQEQAGATDPGKRRVVLVIRGDLLKRYPNTVVYAQHARWGTRPEDQFKLVLWDETGEKSGQDSKDPNVRFPLFRATVPPDLHFVGFDLTLAEVRGHAALAETPQAKASLAFDQLGWFFVMKEIVGEPRFGLDERAGTNASPSSIWDNFSWEHLGADVSVIDVLKPLPPMPAKPNPAKVAWGANAADTAYILYQKPVLVAFHARDMLRKIA